MTAVGQSLPTHSAPVPVNVGYASKSGSKIREWAFVG
jgi:hypothetical protein